MEAALFLTRENSKDRLFNVWNGIYHLKTPKLKKETKQPQPQPSYLKNVIVKIELNKDTRGKVLTCSEFEIPIMEYDTGYEFFFKVQLHKDEKKNKVFGQLSGWDIVSNAQVVGQTVQALENDPTLELTRWTVQLKQLHCEWIELAKCMLQIKTKSLKEEAWKNALNQLLGFCETALQYAEESSKATSREMSSPREVGFRRILSQQYVDMASDLELFIYYGMHSTTVPCLIICLSCLTQTTHLFDVPHSIVSAKRVKMLDKTQLLNSLKMRDEFVFLSDLEVTQGALLSRQAQLQEMRFKLMDTCTSEKTSTWTMFDAKRIYHELKSFLLFIQMEMESSPPSIEKKIDDVEKVSEELSEKSEREERDYVKKRQLVRESKSTSQSEPIQEWSLEKNFQELKFEPLPKEEQPKFDIADTGKKGTRSPFKPRLRPF